MWLTRSLVTLSGVALAFTTTNVFAQSPVETLRSLSANSGQYSNQIPNVIPPEPYTEVCFLGGALFSDVHTISESPVGGNCGPGDIGWVIERDERATEPWDSARGECLKLGMRLPEPFEWQFSCRNAGLFGLNDMVGNNEWASNDAQPQFSSLGGVGVPVYGSFGCGTATWGWAARQDGVDESFTYRCVN